MSDALCKISTGGGLATRKLYSDDEEAVFDIMRPTILNGIDDIAKRQDLLDRAVVINLPSIKGNRRVDEKAFWKEFNILKADILGGLCNIVSQALAALPNTRLTDKPRMADFALWISAAEKALMWQEGYFNSIYNENRDKAIDQGLELDPIAVAVQQFMANKEEWTGTTTETLSRLNQFAGNERINDSKSWTTSNKLKQRLRRIAPALRTKGIEVIELPRSSKGGMIKLVKV